MTLKRIMTILVLTLFTQPSFAERSISDSAGFPEKGDFWVTAGLALVDQEFDVFSTAGSRLTNTEQSTTLLTTQIRWGLNESMGLGVDVNYIIAQSVTTISDPDGTPSTSETEAKGLIDPTFRYALRFLDQENKGFNLDLQTFISPKVITAKDAASTQDGNAGRGQTQIGVGLDLSWDSGPNEFLFTTGVVHNFEGESQEADDPADISTEAAGTDIEVEFEYSYEFNDSLEFSIGESIEIEGKDKSTDSNGSETVVDSSLSFTTEIEVEYHLTPETQTIEFQFLYVIQPDTDARIGTTAVEVRNIKQTAFSLSYKKQF